MLKEYKGKRHSGRTPEPPPEVKSAERGPLIFVVQKHAARRLHYDFRLELNGVLKSWAVPGGPSLNPQVKRLAVMVEDHPLEYASFEGTIPEGEYGAGQVIVWDRGEYSPDNEGKSYFDERKQAQDLIAQGLGDGKLSFFLRGQKLKGSWTLVKMKSGKNNWLLIKHKDEFAEADQDVLEEGASVLSSHSIEEKKIRTAPNSDPPSEMPLSFPGATQGSFPKAIMPMLASTGEAPFASPGWFFEPKLDGYRILATKNKKIVRLLSRNGIDMTEKFRGIAESIKKQSADQLVLDGEIIALDEKGKICFQCLQGFLGVMHRSDSQRTKADAILYYVFDILYFEGYSLLEVPLSQRKKILKKALAPSPSVRLLDHFEGDGKAVYEASIEQGLEGILAKRQDSLYEPGKRSEEWIKIKAIKTDDFIIGGYTQGTGNRARTFGALLLGYYDKKDHLISAGQVGTGFDERSLLDLKKRLDDIKTGKSQFAEMPETNATATWVRPEMVAEIKFAERTQDGKLRAPVFLRLREDKPPEQVRADQTLIDPPSDHLSTMPGGLEGKDVIEGILKQLNQQDETIKLDIGGQTIELSNLDKELWPVLGKRRALTKRDLLIYLVKVSPYLLNHLRDRPITLSRYPDGIQKGHFFQRHWNNQIPDFVETVSLSELNEKPRAYIMCNNLPSLMWLGQIADIELHSWFSRVSAGPDRPIPAKTRKDKQADYLSEYPDFIIFDLDPYIYAGSEKPGDEPELSAKGFTMTCKAARWIKDILDSLSLASFVKTSGRTGLHIYVPIVRQYDFTSVRATARTICEYVLKQHSKEITTDWAVDKRSGKVFLDYNQNVRAKTLASVYSPRPAPEATVSAPLRWEELEKVHPTDFTIMNMPDRLVQLGDLWKGILGAKRDLKQLLKLE